MQYSTFNASLNSSYTIIYVQRLEIMFLTIVVNVLNINYIVIIIIHMATSWYIMLYCIVLYSFNQISLLKMITLG